MDARKYLAELIGTFILVLVGSMSIVAAGMMGPVPVSPLVVAPFGFGLGLLAAIQTAGYVSGGHFNPAVTLAALLDKRIEPMNAVGYWVAQVVGAIAASGLLLLISNQAAVASTASSYPPGQGVQALIVEITLTAIFLLVILTVTKRSPNQAAFAIPLTLTAIHFAGIPFSGAVREPGPVAGTGPDRRGPEHGHPHLDRRPARRRRDRLGHLSRPGGRLDPLIG